jgi:hypothetical protein
MPRRFLFHPRVPQRQLNYSAAQAGDTHAASCHPDMQCSIFCLINAQQLT